ncbi:MAG: hypothetical protein AAFO62_11020 [Pseudomonadota bacterium]
MNKLIKEKLTGVADLPRAVDKGVAGLTQHGFDPDRWPEDVRNAIFD